jgi:hypothetical protein
MSYKALILLPNSFNNPLSETVSLIKSGFKDDTRQIIIKDSSDKIEVTIEDWKSVVYFNSDATVLEESQELAETFATNMVEKSEIEKCSKRFEIVCDEDAEMIFFNDYITIVQELKSLPGAKAWEQAQQEFI